MVILIVCLINSVLLLFLYKLTRTFNKNKNIKYEYVSISF